MGQVVPPRVLAYGSIASDIHLVSAGSCGWRILGTEMPYIRSEMPRPSIPLSIHSMDHLASLTSLSRIFYPSPIKRSRGRYNPFSRNLNTLYPRPTYICISDRYSFPSSPFPPPSSNPSKRSFLVPLSLCLPSSSHIAVSTWLTLRGVLL